MSVRYLIRKLERFAPLTEGDEAFLIAACTGDVRSVARGDDIVSEGDKPDRVHLLLEGWAARYKNLANGDRSIMAFVIPGDLCDTQVVLLNRMDHSITALSNCRVAYIHRQAMQQIFDTKSRIAKAFLWSTLVDEAVLREWLVNVGQRRASLRVGHLLCELLLRVQAVGLTDTDAFEMPISQMQLADTLGMSQVHINRMLKNLRILGLVTVTGHEVRIHDMKKLSKLVGYNSNYLHLDPHAD